MSFEIKCNITYTVRSLDVLGHSANECKDYDCPCNDLSSGRYHHNDRICQCDYQVNDSSSVGTIEIETDEGATYNIDLPEHTFTSWWISNEAILKSLIDNGFLKEGVILDKIEIGGTVDEDLTIDQKDNGKPIFQLEFESKVDIVEHEDAISDESLEMLKAGIKSGQEEPSVYLGSFKDKNE